MPSDSQCKRFGQTCGAGAYGDEGECCYEKGLTCIQSSTLAPGAQSACGGKNKLHTLEYLDVLIFITKF